MNLQVLNSSLRPQVETLKEQIKLLEEDKVLLKTAVDVRTAESIHNECKNYTHTIYIYIYFFFHLS